MLVRCRRSTRATGERFRACLFETGRRRAALNAQAVGERIANRLLVTVARSTLGRLAAANGDWPAARRHALANLDACAEGGYATYVPGCLDSLAEVAAGLHHHRDAVRLLAAAERARALIGAVRVSPETDHWNAIETRLHHALGADAYAAARAEGADLGTDGALEWARRSRGPRGRPPGGWASLTPTEAKVVDLVAEGLSKPRGWLLLPRNATRCCGPCSSTSAGRSQSSWASGRSR
jgi:hypothetical protein